MARKTVSKKAVTKLKKTAKSSRAEVLVKKKKLRFPTKKQVIRAALWPFVTPYRYLRKKRNDATHKSFVRTRGRDKIKKPKLEGFFKFPWYVVGVLWRDKWLWLRFLLVCVVLSASVLSALQVTNIVSVNQIIDTAGDASDSVIEPVTRAAVTVGSALAGALNANLTDVQYLAVAMIGIFTCLVVVWLIRQRLAGNKVTVRDGLYSAGAPVLSLFVLVIVGVMQLVPLALAALVYVSATAGNILNGGIETAMFTGALVLAVVLTLYFMTTTLFAMFIATIPGTYPFRAYGVSRKIVAGQRMRLLFRLLWMALLLLLIWFFVLIPVVIVTNSFGGQNTVVIPLAVQLMAGVSLLYGTAYAYLLYRRMIDDPVNEK